MQRFLLGHGIVEFALLAIAFLLLKLLYNRVDVSDIKHIAKNLHHHLQGSEARVVEELGELDEDFLVLYAGIEVLAPAEIDVGDPVERLNASDLLVNTAKPEFPRHSSHDPEQTLHLGHDPSVPKVVAILVDTIDLPTLERLERLAGEGRRKLDRLRVHEDHAEAFCNLRSQVRRVLADGLQRVARQRVEMNLGVWICKPPDLTGAFFAGCFRARWGIATSDWVVATWIGWLATFRCLKLSVLLCPSYKMLGVRIGNNPIRVRNTPHRLGSVRIFDPDLSPLRVPCHKGRSVPLTQRAIKREDLIQCVFVQGVAIELIVGCNTSHAGVPDDR